MKWFPLLLVLTLPVISQAYPQMIRHGYTNCMTCHVNPRGGNMMTDYGRALSKEVLSTWGYQGEENWHYGALSKTPDWLKLGGDFRALQVHSNNEQATIGRFIEMQEQVELAVALKRFVFNITPSSDTLQKGKPWGIHRFFVQSQITDHLNVRVGKFVPRFGINMPEHVFSTRGPVGFGYQAERDSLEVSYIENKFDVSLAATIGEMRDRSEATGFYGQANYSVGTHDRLGLSFEKKTKGDQASSIGAHALIGFTEHFYLATDSVYREKEDAAGTKTDGFFHFTKLGYELEKGFHVIAVGDVRKSDLSQNQITDSFYGGGIAFFPRPHFEFQGVFTKRKNLARSSKEGDYAWLMMHFYL